MTHSPGMGTRRELGVLLGGSPEKRGHVPFTAPIEPELQPGTWVGQGQEQREWLTRDLRCAAGNPSLWQRFRWWLLYKRMGW